MDRLIIIVLDEGVIKIEGENVFQRCGFSPTLVYLMVMVMWVSCVGFFSFVVLVV